MANQLFGNIAENGFTTDAPSCRQLNVTAV